MPQSRPHGLAAKNRILDAAEELMAAYGYSGTSLSQLVKACSLSASTIYWHFGSKEGVMAAMLERGIGRYLDEAEAAANAPGDSGTEGLNALFRAIEKRPQALRLAVILGMEEGPHGGIGGERVASIRKRGWSIIRSLVARSLDLPVDSEEVDELAAFIFAALDGAVILERLDGKPLTQVLRPLFELIASRQKRPVGRMSASRKGRG
jgi:AcrR family transcriptional regulator